MNRKAEILLIFVGLVIAGFAWLFGDNIYLQSTGRSIIEDARRYFANEPLPTQAPTIVVITATSSTAVSQQAVIATPTTQITEIAINPTSIRSTDTSQPNAIQAGLLPANTPPPSRNSCLATEYTFLGDGWVSQAMFIPTQAGAFRIFSHCPPMTTIQYDSISVDDEIQKVELVCRNSTTDITSLFQPFSVEGELLLHWRSSRITLESECRIDFTIKDNAGVNIGLQLKKSEP